jgi:2-methylisocitrate lyase-like PEP mutase family enzyme
VDDTQRERAERLRSLHRPGSPLVLVNAWDAASARVVASVGAPAVATSSAAMAWALGYRDGEGVPLEGFNEALARIVAVVDVPVTVDIEAGFGTSPAAVASTVRKVVAAGAVGVNLEDRVLPQPGPKGELHSIPDQQVRIRAARAAAEAMGIPLVINARTDVYLEEIGEPSTRLAHAAERGAAYLAAGADCVFVPGPREAAAIGEVCKAIDGPVNILAVPGTPPVPELANLGAARVSLGSWPSRSVLGLLQRAAQSVYATGFFTQLDGALSYATAQSLLAPAKPSLASTT